ncbi:response regulator [Undibacterium sp. TS12]|uniref:response regulator n=1 Tax=Undibacterium sp. TS12 TaxID=2908202 RepID=UPI001F4D3319|nr:response regulator [Undibacterium sp. TS12]MCH8621820.1 response regulator [Undibacterium sp. TS12]
MNNMSSALAGASRKILIAVFGLSDYELRLVRSVLSLTMVSGRKHSYALFDAAQIAAPDIVILDPDNIQARTALQTLIESRNISEPATVFISNAGQARPGKYHLLHPLVPTKMLALLDQVADELDRVLPASPSPTATVASLVSPASQTELPDQVVAQPLLQKPTTAPVLQTAHRALIVDDSPTARIKIDLELRSMKIASDCAETGEQALQMLEKKAYDIIFLDIVMPGADGYEICKIIRRHPQTKRTPVVMLTSKSSPFDRIRGSLSGCSSYLTKPVEHLKFRAVVEKILATDDAIFTMDKGHDLAMGT